MQPAKLAHMFGWRHIHRSKQLHQLIPGRRVHVIIKNLSTEQPVPWKRGLSPSGICGPVKWPGDIHRICPGKGRSREICVRANQMPDMAFLPAHEGTGHHISLLPRYTKLVSTLKLLPKGDKSVITLGVGILYPRYKYFPPASALGKYLVPRQYPAYSLPLV
jgi:hypothetical protein